MVKGGSEQSLLAAFQQGIYIIANDVMEWRMQKHSSAAKNRGLLKNRDRGVVKI